MKTNIKILVGTLPVLVLLSSCSSAYTPNPNNGNNPDQKLQSSSGSARNDMFRNGSGSRMRDGSGSLRGGRGFSGSTINSLKPEDRALFDQMRQARQSGDTAKEQEIRAKLESKYPDLFKFKPNN